MIAARPKPCSPCAETIVLPQGDFGPPIISVYLVGEPWNQWQVGPHDLPEYNAAINVVIYRGLDLAEVKRRYPVVRGESDYRYVEYSRAIEFFEKNIKEAESYKDGGWAPSLVKAWDETAALLKNTRSVTIQTLGA